MKMTPEKQDENLHKILGAWPNTYTFTKSMAERTLRKKRPQNLPMVLLRPSIIIGGYNEPVEGWCDTLSAAGGLSVGGGSGFIRYINAKKTNVTDLIPVDYVSNQIIVVSALEAFKPKLTIIHSGTSHQNPVTWSDYLDVGFKYLAY